MQIDFEYEFEDRILKRGYEYYNNNCVHNVTFNDNIIVADIIGTKNYKTCIEIEDNLFVDGECSCPYFSEGMYCKHIAALLYYINENSIDNKYCNSNEEELYKIIRKIDKKELEEFLVKLLIRNENIHDEFRLRFSNLFPNLSLNEYKRRIYEAIMISGGRDGFIDYNESYDYTHNMFKIINEAKNLVIDEKYELAFGIVSNILDTIPNTSIDDSNGSTGEVSESCIEIIIKIINEVLDNKDILLKDILNYILEEIKTDNLSNYGIELYELLNIYIDNNKYIKEIKEVLVDVLNKSKSGKYFWKTKYYIDMLIYIYEKEKDNSKIINLLEEYSYEESICLKLVDEYLKLNKVKDSINLLKKNLKETKRCSYALKLSDIYVNENMLDEYKKILYKIFYEYDKYDINIYKKIKELYNSNEWLKECKNIISNIEKDKYFYEIMQIYIEENMFDDMFSLLKGRDMDSIITYEEYLLPKYNKELINIYVKYCKNFVNSANNRKLYRELAKYIRHIKYMDDNKLEYKELMDEIKLYFRSRPAMEDELKGL